MITYPWDNILIVEQARELRWWFQVVDNDGTVQDLSDMDYDRVLLQVRDTTLSEGGELLMALDSDSGGIVLDYGAIDDGSIQSGYIYAPASITKELEPWGEGVYDMVGIQSGTSPDTISRGVAILIPTVTDLEGVL